MDHLSENTIPWHLISSALQGTLSPEEDAALQQWIASGVQNRELFMQLKNTWHNDLDDLPAYLHANEAIAWNALLGKLEEQVSVQKNEQVIAIADVRKKRARLISLVSIAALLVMVTGFVIWYMKANSSSNYKTGNTEQQSVALADGSIIKLFPSSSMEVPEGYNVVERKVVLKNGEAFFEVRHKEEIPFIVDLGSASIKDIGTSFRIKKTNGIIHVTVVTGTVEFRNNANNEVRLLKAGMQATLQPGTGNSRSLIAIDSNATTDENRLHFINTSLPEVTRRFQAVYNKQIIITDPAIMQKRFTGHLEGQSFDDAMDVLCKSLNITLVHKNDLYYLREE